MKSFTEIKSDLTAICQLYKLGELKGYKTENHSAEGFKVAKFETTNGNYEYIFKN
mgnify:CR=1 FL=1